MAIVLYGGGGVTGIRGSIGGVTFSANKSGSFARLWGRPSTQRSVLQVTARRELGFWAQAWAGIGAVDQAAWDVWAADPAQELTNALGVVYNLSGFQAYVRTNIWLATVARAAVSVPPVSSKPAAPTGIGMTLAKTGPVCEVGWGALEHFSPTWDLVAELVIGVSIGRLAVPIGFKVLAGVQVPTGFVVDLSTQFVARFGLSEVGQPGFVRVWKQTIDGYRGNPSIARTVTV